MVIQLQVKNDKEAVLLEKSKNYLKTSTYSAAFWKAMELAIEAIEEENRQGFREKVIPKLSGQSEKKSG